MRENADQNNAEYGHFSRSGGKGKGEIFEYGWKVEVMKILVKGEFV